MSWHRASYNFSVEACVEAGKRVLLVGLTYDLITWKAEGYYEIRFKPCKVRGVRSNLLILDDYV